MTHALVVLGVLMIIALSFTIACVILEALIELKTLGGRK